MTHAFAEVLNGSRWLMEPNAMLALLTRTLATTAHEVEAARIAFAALPDRLVQPAMIGDVAVISATGPVVYKLSWFSMLFGCPSIELMQQQHRIALADPAVRTIVYRCDTPGGTVEMLPEFADEIFASRGKKQIIFVADTMIASAGYWLAAQGDVIYATRSSQLGSIGAYCEHEDISGMLDRLGVKITFIAHPAKKVEGNPYEPLTDEAKADYQAFVDEIGREFEAAVARGRGVSAERVLQWTQLGIPPRGKRAIELGLADKTGTFEGLIHQLQKPRGGARAIAGAGLVIEANVHASTELLDRMRASVPESEAEAAPDAKEPTVDPTKAAAAEQATAEAEATAAAAQRQADQDAIDVTLALTENP